ncbi:hypothetical protein L6452_01321 [Arctium lappa]|uniref:Uncharacterized protein n=1 Tax=Arctium lappa TaxID=4217 RepID=A0ACB9FGS9_ARCLA|nr:hypothetical protein L6452_01321 [Arctium lappa]
MLIYQRHSHPRISPSTDNSDIDESKSISISLNAPSVVDGGELQPEFGGIEPEIVAVIEAKNNHSPLTYGDEDNDRNKLTSEVASSSLHVETGDGAYEEELASMTRGMSRAKLVGFMESLEGEWVGRGERRRRVVDAEEFVNALPVNWKIELALRKRGGIHSIYCRRYVSTSGIQFKSCKEAAFYLRDQSLSNVAEEEASEEMRQMENASHKVPKSVNEVGSSSVPEANANLPPIDNLFDVKVASLIDCSSCGITFEDIRGLEKHLASVHKETTRRFDLPTSEGVAHRTSEKQHAAMDIDEPNLDKPYTLQNGEGSSSSRKIAKTQESVGVSNERFKTNCTWCNKGFLSEPVDAETMADATGFMCPQCKDKICGVFERSLSRSHQP